jgi:hypothetical protein
MLCAELEQLEEQYDHIVTALENPNLTDDERRVLLNAREQLIQAIREHQMFGHKGGPCFEE